VWIATADVKDLHMKGVRGYRPILERFEEMAKGGVRFRFIHAKIPSGPFRNTLERLPTLFEGALEMQICPRSHWKMVVVDHAVAYFGSANFTGAGIGVKSERRRNLEVGAITEDPALVRELAKRFDAFWIGEHCRDCAFRRTCPDPI
jgi:phosphatidylserine/phosphatidylglycerophosphate/cardiolipin synthase-like enzyme